jgi:hypothetical protein
MIRDSLTAALASLVTISLLALMCYGFFPRELSRDYAGLWWFGALIAVFIGSYLRRRQ